MTLWLPVWLPQMDKHSKNQWAVQDLNLWPLPCQGADPAAQEALSSL